MQRACGKWWLLLYMVHQLLISTSRAVCPPSDTILPCRCSNVADETQIWCSYSNLPSVMGAIQRLGSTLHSRIDEMILEGNNLPSLPGRNFEGLQVIRLMLRDNGLERVTSNWLATLEPALQELFIIEHRLRTLPPDILDHLHQLEAVTFQAGLMKRAPRFAHLPKLRYVQIQSPILMEITPENFGDLPNLEQLHIVGSPLLTKLNSGLLQNLPKLSLVDFSNCSVSWIHPKTFLDLPSLKEISLMWNRLSDAAVIGKACRELRSLQILRLDNNFIDRLIEGSFVDLPALQELYLSGNMISEIHGGAFRSTPSLKILDLSRNLLRRVNAAAFLYPSGASLEELWLIDNQLYQVNELKALFSSLPRLKFIDMSKNHMEELPFDVLRGHPNLERLHLNENRITRLPKKAFAGMTSLRELRLRNNSISVYPESAAWNLPSLKGLDLSQNKIKRLDARLMTYLPSLRRLDLSENMIDTVLPDSFIGNLNLETINLSKNFITSFHALTFSHLPKLYELDASWNRLREVVQGLPRDIEYLKLGQNQIFTLPAPPSELNLPHLRLLDLNGNALQVIQQNTFASMSKLQWLYLHDNLIQVIEKGSLNGLSRLEVLNLKNNRLREINGDYFKGLKGLKEFNLEGNYLEIIARGILDYSPKLETLKLGNNKITEIQSGAFSHSRELQELNLTHNFLDRFPEALQGLKMLRSLDINHNNMQSIQPYFFETLPSLTELHLANNRLYELQSNVFSDLQKLEFLDLNRNELENMSPRSISSLPSLLVLQIGGNRLTSITEETFVDLPELQSLDLQSNHLQTISERAFVNTPHLTLLNLSHNLLIDLEKAGVKELRSLEVLDISDNKVSFIDGSNFKGMDWLVELKMDNNMICHIHGAPFNELSRLRVLSLRYNRMTTVTETAFQQLRNNVAILDIDGNPLSCSCRMLWLQSWLRDTTALGPRCSDGTLFRDARLSRTDCANSRIVEPVVPGCEEQGQRSPAIEVLHVTPQNATSPHSMDLKLPQTGEPEYVYDEYVEYEEVNGTESPPTLVPIDVTAGEMKTSPHLISGDTPTIYAQQKPPKLNLSNPGLGYDDLKKAQQLQTPGSPHGGYNGLTFFGIPLPNFSLGNIWKGRSTENAYKKGKVQPVNPSSRHRQNFVTIEPLQEKKELSTEIYPPFSSSEASSDDQYSSSPASFERGFQPMLPDETQEKYPSLYKPFQSSPIPKVPDDHPILLDVPPPSFSSDNLPSTNLPKEHRTTEEESEPQWKESEGNKESESIEKTPHPGKVESIILSKKNNSLEASNFPLPTIPPDIETSGSENFFQIPNQQTNYESKPQVSGDTSLEGSPSENDVLLSQPTIHKYSTNHVDSWYFQNYNKTNIQPFVERSYTSQGSKRDLPFISILLSVIFLYSL